MQYTPSLSNMLKTAGVAMLMALVLISFVAQQPITLVFGSFVCAVYAVIAYRSARIRKDHMQVFLCVCVLFIPAFIKPGFGLSPTFYFLSTVSSFFAAKAIARYPSEVIFAAFRLIFGAAVMAVCWILYVYWGHPEPFGEVIEGSSANGIPSYLIVIQIGLSLSTYLVRGQLPVLSPILTFAVAYFGFGRGSLVVAGLIIILSLLFNMALVRSVTRSWYALHIVVLITIGIFLLSQWDELLNQLISDTKFSYGLVDYNRVDMWNSYIGKLNVWTLLVGTDFQGTVIDILYNGNPHISYIRTHSYFGLPLTLLALVSPLIVFFSGKAWNSQLVFAFFLSMATLRATTEPILFPTLLDFFYFLYFFLFFRYAQAPKKQNWRR